MANTKFKIDGGKIVALKDISFYYDGANLLTIKAGTVGGSIQYESNLDSNDTSWIFDGVEVTGSSTVITSNSIIRGKVQIS